MTETQQRVYDAALGLIKQRGLINLTLSDVCTLSGIADGSFSYIMGRTFSDFQAELRDYDPGPLPCSVTKKRVPPAVRRDYVLAVALEMASEDNYRRITRDAIARRAGMAMGSVTRCFGTMAQLRRGLMRAAINAECIEVIAQGIADRDEQALKASPALIARARDLLIERCRGAM